MASGEPNADPTAAPSAGALYCSSCNMWINGSEQFWEHRTGKKHRRKFRALQQPQPTGDQLYWARFAA
eukprot:9920354-Lingulodinium_polyedra.AAC.1